MLSEHDKRKLAQHAPAALFEATIQDPPLTADGMLRVEVDSAKGVIQTCPWDGAGSPRGGDAAVVMESDAGNFWVLEWWSNSGAPAGGNGSMRWLREWDPLGGYTPGDAVKHGGGSFVNIAPVDAPAPSGPSDPPPAFGWNTETPRPSDGWLALDREVTGNTTGKDPMQENDAPGVQWLIEVTVAGVFSFSTRDPTGVGWDSYLYLEDFNDGPSGNILWSDDDGGPGAMSYISGKPLTPGIYVVRLEGYRSTEHGAYGLTVSSPDGQVDDHGWSPGGAGNPTPDNDTAHWDSLGGGAGGSVIRHGSGPPPDSLGNVGDFYIDDGDPMNPILYGPKT